METIFTIRRKTLDQPSVEKQCSLIQEVIHNLIGAESKVWLSSPYFPLPGDNDVPVLPYSSSTKIVTEAYKNQLLVFENGENRPEIVFDSPKKPRKIAIPLVSQDNMLGILEVSRLKWKFF